MTVVVSAPIGKVGLLSTGGLRLRLRLRARISGHGVEIRRRRSQVVLVRRRDHVGGRWYVVLRSGGLGRRADDH